MESKRFTFVRIICLCFIVITSSCSNPKPFEGNVYSTQILKVREEKDNAFKLAENSPLNPQERESFNGLKYFRIQEKYKAKARFIKLLNNSEILLKTTGESQKRYNQFAQIELELEGKLFNLTAYSESNGIGESSLFIPFNDQTNKDLTYKGGRYIEMPLPKEKEFIIDFNLAFHPFCVYNYKYVCPIPPTENTLSIAIEAGEKL